MNFYHVIKSVHSWTGWVILIVGLVAIILALTGWLMRREYSKLDNAIGGSFAGLMHLQLLVGLMVYVISPLALGAIRTVGMGTVMTNPVYRFFAVEHLIMMILAVVFVQIGRTKSKRARKNINKHKKAAIFFILGFGFILSRVPWDRIF